MAEIVLAPRPALGGLDREIGAGRIRERHDLALVSVAVPSGGEEALAAALREGFSLSMPEPRVSSVAGETRAIRTAPDQIMLLFPHRAPDAEKVRSALGGAGYTTDQTDVWVVIEVSGRGTLRALERLCPLDLDERAFPVDVAARTVMEHMGAMIVRLGPDRFLLMSASSSARSFLHAVETSYAWTAP